MSLDVYLKSKTKVKKIPASSIFIREKGQTICLTPEQWNEKFPDNPISIDQNDKEEIKTNVMYHGNITHNLGKMAAEANLYYALWRPEELQDIYVAEDLVPLLESGLKTLKDYPNLFKSFNPENGWGTYEVLVEFVEDYLEACKQYSDCEIHVSR